MKLINLWYQLVDFWRLKLVGQKKAYFANEIRFFHLALVILVISLSLIAGFYYVKTEKCLENQIELER